MQQNFFRMGPFWPFLRFLSLSCCCVVGLLTEGSMHGQAAKRVEKAEKRGKRPEPGAQLPPLRQRDAMLSHVRAFQRLRPEDRNALLTEKVLVCPLRAFCTSLSGITGFHNFIEQHVRIHLVSLLFPSLSISPPTLCLSVCLCVSVCLGLLLFQFSSMLGVLNMLEISIQMQENHCNFALLQE